MEQCLLLVFCTYYSHDKYRLFGNGIRIWRSLKKLVVYSSFHSLSLANLAFNHGSNCIANLRQSLEHTCSQRLLMLMSIALTFSVAAYWYVSIVEKLVSTFVGTICKKYWNMWLSTRITQWKKTCKKIDELGAKLLADEAWFDQVIVWARKVCPLQITVRSIAFDLITAFTFAIQQNSIVSTETLVFICNNRADRTSQLSMVWKCELVPTG